MAFFELSKCPSYQREYDGCQLLFAPAHNNWKVVFVHNWRRKEDNDLSGPPAAPMSNDA
jgi:hypothetical protein